jgi:zinc transporter ZupT
MADLSLDLRIGSIFIIWAASAAGVGLPFFVSAAAPDNKELATFRCLKAAAAGVMLGIALMHLLPEADEELSEIIPEYSLAFALTAFGIIVNLTMEQVALMCLASRRLAKKALRVPLTRNEREESSVGMSRTDSMEALEHGERCGFVKCEHGSQFTAIGKQTPFAGINSATLVDPKNILALTPRGTSTTEEVADVKSSNDDDAGSDEGAELVAGLIEAQGLRELVALYAMELSVSVHSIIIGVDIGLLAGAGSLTTLVALICAIAFHQTIEGLGLGTVLLSVRGQANASLTKLAVFVALFTCSTPAGILIGICTSSSGQSTAGSVAKGTANALAAGSLLYISLTEMLAAYFSSSDLARRPALKLAMIASFAAGVTFMAVIAVWA